MSLQHLTSRNGKQQLLFDRFRYVLERQRNVKRNWRCVKYDGELRCRGRCISIENTAWLTANHNHPPSNNDTVSNPSKHVSTVPSDFSTVQKYTYDSSSQPEPEHFSDEPDTSYPSHHGSFDSYDDESIVSENYKSTLEHNGRKPIRNKVTDLSKRMRKARPFSRSSTPQKQFHNTSIHTEPEHFSELSDTSYSTDSGDEESNKSYTSESCDEVSDVTESNQSNLEDTLFVIKEVLDRKKQNGVDLVLVSWVGYPKTVTKWITASEVVEL
jgi:hypothetical protein